MHGSKEMVISGVESCSGVHDTSDTQAVVVIQDEAKLESNVGHHTLDGNWDNSMMSLCLEDLNIVQENDVFLAASMASISRSGRSATSDTSDQQAHTCSIRGNGDTLKDLLPNVLPILIVKVGVVGIGKILALLQVLLLLLLLGADTIDHLPGIFGNARVACIRALDDINTILQK